MNENFIKDIMSQNYQFDNFYDPTKLFIVYSLIDDNGFKNLYTLEEISTIVYRLYLSNIDIAYSNLNIIIRNIEKYGVSDICPYVASVINQWIREQKNGSFKFNGKQLALYIEDYSKQSSDLIKTVCNTLFKKYYKNELKPIYNFSACENIDDRDLNAFGNCILKSLIFEDIQYCPLCEETDKNKLVVTHILFNDESHDQMTKTDKNNLLLLCIKEAEDYISGKFYFDEFGRVVNICSTNVNNKMRLPQSFLNKYRRTYLKEHTLIKQ